MKFLYLFVRELEFPHKIGSGHQDSTEGGKIQFPNQLSINRSAYPFRVAKI